MKSLLVFLLLFPSFVFAEEPPEPEYPYPKTRKVQRDMEQPESIDSRGAYYYSTKKNNQKKKKFIDGVERPYKIGKDGSYYYETDSKKKRKAYKGVEQPIDEDDDGAYYYKRTKKGRKKKNRYSGNPTKINSDGSYIYDQDRSQVKNTLYLRGGMFGPPDIKSSTTGTSFSDVYSDSNAFVFNVEYDWKIFSSVFLKVGSGLSTAKGQGQFAGGTNTIAPRESYLFYIFPNTLSLSYKFQLWDIQYLTPYVEGGGGYFTFIESRTDGKSTKFGGAPVMTASAGLLISLSLFESGSQMQSDYGVQQSWIELQYKQIFGLDSRKDFSSNMITGGFAVGF